MNYSQQEEKEFKLQRLIEVYRSCKNEINSIKELSLKLGKGFSTSTIQRYFHELYKKNIIDKDEYDEICIWLSNNKKISTSIGGKVSQEKHGYSKDELGHFTGGRKL